ncbi:GDSL esterase/lipase At5g45910 [Zea mays]|uniref:Esterase n=1 Tax=Zea mays TaxID=4577 RepID=B6TKT8_MAIZE|nr:GDSL esterase/lipase At5g45910 [Zea mays]ACG37721.1 esterase precursor [Zea mays]|eukprot:NP_001150078.1 esterase [Zea mays]
MRVGPRRHSCLPPTPAAAMAVAHAPPRRGVLPLLLVAALVAALPATCAAARSKKSYTAIFSFGDSLSDAGNLIVNGTPKALTTARPPYGMTFFRKPTGRCSNGRLVVDFLAEHFGLPLPPPSQAKGKDFKKGANFAITGATALEYSFFKAHGIDQRIWNTGSINTQIGWLQDMKPSLCKSEQDCKDYFSKSLFVVGEFGGNDYNAPLFSGVPFSDVKTYVPLVAKAIANGVEKLIELGATDLLVPGVLPIGCFPLYLTLYNTSSKADYNARTGCLRRYNRLAFHHNRELKQQLDELQKKYPKTKIMYGDYFKAALQFVVNPGKFGFSTALQACCGAGGQGNYNFNLKKKCGEQGASVCSNPSSYVSWDGIHMTEAAYRKVADGWLNGPYAQPPILKS